jgi:hypothetical protein
MDRIVRSFGARGRDAMALFPAHCAFAERGNSSWTGSRGMRAAVDAAARPGSCGCGGSIVCLCCRLRTTAAALKNAA